MKRHNFHALSLAIFAATTLACAEPASPPTSPAATESGISGAGPDGSTLKVSAPSPISPVGGIELDDDDPDLVIANSTASFTANPSLMYVFEVFEEDQLVYRSEPIAPGGDGRTSHETAVVIDPDEEYTWHAYAVFEGARGPKSSTESFRTANRYGVSCGGSELDIVACRKAQYGFIPHDELHVFLEKVAFDLNRAGHEHRSYGRLVKTTGNNCHGYSCDIICSNANGMQRQWDVLIDEDAAQVPVWNRVGNVAVRHCEAAR